MISLIIVVFGTVVKVPPKKAELVVYSEEQTRFVKKHQGAYYRN